MVGLRRILANALMSLSKLRVNTKALICVSKLGVNLQVFVKLLSCDSCRIIMQLNTY
jgi:hypothetical protein